MNLRQLRTIMANYDCNNAFGAYCDAWVDFVGDCYDTFGFAPWDERAGNTEVPEEMLAYWLDVANDVVDDYLV